MTLPNSLLRAIGQTVQDAAGTMDDVDELVEAWRRLDADLDCRAARLRFEAEQAPCCCAKPAEPDAGGRCARCYGRLEVER